jgi:hypothetical protein
MASRFPEKRCLAPFQIAPEKYGMAETLRLLALIREKWEAR